MNRLLGLLLVLLSTALPAWSETEVEQALREANEQLEQRLKALETEDESLKGNLDQAQVRLDELKSRHGELPEALRQGADTSLRYLGGSLLGPMDVEVNQRLETERKAVHKADAASIEHLWRPLLAAIESQGRINEQEARLIEPEG